MLFDTYYLWVEPRKSGTGAEYEYVEETGLFTIVQRIRSDGILHPDGLRGAQILIAGKKTLGGLPIEIQIRKGLPKEYGDTAQRQTQYLPDGPERSVIKNCIGHVRYSPPSEYEGQKFKETLWAEIIVEDWMMTDLWSAIRTPGVGLFRLSMSLFGHPLVQVQNYIQTTYHWVSNDHGEHGPLYVASFQYMTENGGAPFRGERRGS